MTKSVAFDRAADYYDATRGFPLGTEPHIVACIQQAGGLTPSSRIIEIGIGTGRIALPIAPTVSAVYGLDISRPMLSRLIAKRQAEPVYLAQGDATQLPFPDNAFDAAVVVHVFHLIPAWQAALVELRRVLCRDGVLVHCWTESDDLFRPLWQAWDAVLEGVELTAGVEWKRNPTFLQDEGWQAKGEPITHRYYFETTPAQFVQMLRRRIWSRTWGMSDELFERGVAAVEAAIPQHFPDANLTIQNGNNFIVQAYAPPV